MTCRSAVALTVSVALLGACAQQPPNTAPTTVPALLERVMPTPVLLLGEQHDAPEHQALQRDVVLALGARGQLGALVMEMAEQGRQTTGLPADASEARVREALAWTDDAATGWPWATYGPVVMAAVRAGAPVLGGNLPRSQMRAAMGNAALEGRIGSAALQEQREGIRSGHCDLLPEGQIGPMTRIQLARDDAMARTTVAAVEKAGAGKTVVLVAGNGHVRRDLGVPLYLPKALEHRVVMAQAGGPRAATPSDAVWLTPPQPARDHCAELRQQFKR
ncbi:ChaN family lipoprotein [Hydrogenophaga sp.]|uniref:ChaN family lipoprotein n=1 Tax=Hydrogenophaga sp. TaxID=1904254 RepID=UPI002730530E|nr:ChaN family lipoprotein [Hydrogenophaga sp.]MDP3168269.1 ChaN family lipoprotein [Hydrogenophaga sp.]